MKKKAHQLVNLLLSLKKANEGIDELSDRD